MRLSWPAAREPGSGRRVEKIAPSSCWPFPAKGRCSSPRWTGWKDSFLRERLRIATTARLVDPICRAIARRRERCNSGRAVQTRHGTGDRPGSGASLARRSRRRHGRHAVGPRDSPAGDVSRGTRNGARPGARGPLPPGHVRNQTDLPRRIIRIHRTRRGTRHDARFAPCLRRRVLPRKAEGRDCRGVYLASGRFYWNSGIFVWKARTILDELAKNRPAIVEHLNKIGQRDRHAGLPERSGDRIRRDRSNLNRFRRHGTRRKRRRHRSAV